MQELWKYYKTENWNYFLNNVVPVEFEKYQGFYEEIKKEQFFSDDIYKVIATLSSFMFNDKIENYYQWLHQKQLMLDGQTPIDIIKLPNGLNSLKEYLLRYPKI